MVLSKNIQKYKYLPIILVVSAISIFINGYQFGVSDQLLYIPVIHKILDPGLYQNDMLFEQQSGYYTLFLYITAYLTKIFGMEWTFFILYFIATFILFFSVYKISISLFRSEWTGYIAIALCFLTRPIGGTAAGGTPFLTLRTFALPVTLLAVWLFFERRYVWTAIVSAIAFLIHPLTAIAPIMAIMGYIVFNFKTIGKINVIKSLSAYALTMLPLLLKVLISEQTNYNDLSLFSAAPKDWLDILKMRNTYTFPSMWKVEDWKFTISYPVLFIFSFIFSGIKPRFEAIWLVGAGLLTLLISYVFGDLYPVPLVVQLQMARGIFMITFISLIYSAYVLYRFSTGHAIISRLVIILSGIGIASLNTNLIIAGIAALIIAVVSERVKYLNFLGFVPFIVYLYLNLKKFRINDLPILYIFAFIIILEVLRRILRKVDIRAYMPIPVLVFAIIYFNLPIVNNIIKGKISDKTHLPGMVPETSWIRLQKWAIDNTDKNSLFIVPRDQTGFRIYSMRSIAGDWKDGAPGLFSQGYARKWYDRMKLLENYNNLSESDFLRLAKDYGATHIITQGKELGFERIYNSEGYNVYKLPF
jgi:hypothetical protein